MNRYGAEFLGTFWLVLGGCGSAVIAAAFPEVGIGLVGVSLAFGLTTLICNEDVGLSLKLAGCILSVVILAGLWNYWRHRCRI